MNILFIKPFFVGFMVSEILRVSVFGYCPYSVTFPYTTHINNTYTYINTEYYIYYVVNNILKMCLNDLYIFIC